MKNTHSANYRYFTSESVTEGHPDKAADLISDAILDAHLASDPNARVAIETMLTSKAVVLSGEISSTAEVDYEKIVRATLTEIGYVGDAFNDYNERCGIIAHIVGQSPEIAIGVNAQGQNLEGAGDQGMMFGFAIRDSFHTSLMPLPIVLAHRLTRRLAWLRKEDGCDFFLPDGKAQVTVRFGDYGDSPEISKVVVSTQHSPKITIPALRHLVRKEVVEAVIEQPLKDEDVLINPTWAGLFTLGGPLADTGLTGRKIIADTYGGWVPHGGGAFSGKDPTKVDRSGHYMARYVAKNVVAAGLADQLLIQVAYAIGRAEPVSFDFDTMGTGRITNERLHEAISATFDFRPGAIIRHLQLRRPIYKQTATYGHFGRDDKDFPWERLDRVEALRKWLD
ncbi:MAG TPA: methionine adenosyltransferase [Thermotogota bacterium]|jgi:S-adenosylmethionine synthetase|nr:methionine adenosyltransferase [Thermotogota bacterium]OQC32143.1 MAG: S-adenosylmethionine synthase [Thermotogota bacterium ADurb.Bin062]HNW46862.1 methionine adenosyltransferase [Thermotogota bacterium]HOD91646.1 methionine adenosyltransferase [Thermotogota bacterium]HPG98365.1 methionine adenosyltransferase [Thermotogota bacterium]